MHKLISYSTNQTQPTREQTPTKPHAGLLSVSAQGLDLLKNDQMSPLVYWEFTWNELTGSTLNNESALYFSV